jgi:hypothetical protein
MLEQLVNYRKAFWKSPHHAWLGVLTLGAGFLSAQPLFLLVGVAAYALGWVYLPDTAFFRGWVDRKRESIEQQDLKAEIDDFKSRQTKLLQDLMSSAKTRYQSLAAVCREIEKTIATDPLGAANTGSDPRLQKLDELMWTYLKLLSMDQSLAQFLESERQEGLATRILETEREVQALTSEVDSLKTAQKTDLLEPRERLRNSRLELLGVLQKRQQRYEQALANLHLVQSEEERLEQQIKLLRADALAIRNTETFSSRIDATVEQLNQTNRWLSEMDDYRDLVGAMPQANQRVGFGTESSPPILPSVKPQKQPFK